jgi:DNA-binding NarL/FixJ family response regulator
MQHNLSSHSHLRIPVFVLAHNDDEFVRLSAKLYGSDKVTEPLCFTSYSEAMKHLTCIDSAVVLISYHFDGNRGFRATQELKAASSGLRLAGYSFHYIPKHLYSMIHAGCSSFFREHIKTETLHAMIEDIATGRRYYHDEYTAGIDTEIKACIAGAHAWWREDLTDEMIEIGKEIYEGKPYKVIEQKLGLSKDRVNNVMKIAKNRLHIYNSLDLVRTLIREFKMQG